MSLLCLLATALFSTVLNGAGEITGPPQQTTTQTSKPPTGAPPVPQTEDTDLARIPGPAEQNVPAKPEVPGMVSANQRISVENAFITSPQRTGQLVPSSSKEFPVASWQNLLFFDIRKRWPVHDRLTFAFSDRLNLRSEADISLLSHEDVINNFREGFLSWEPVDRLYFDLGRINVKSGAALGFNPTDFFKTRAVQVPLTADPSSLREDRFGTLMLETQYIGDGRALTIAIAPSLVSPGPIYTNTNLPSFNPSIGSTNAYTRVLIKGSVTLGQDFSPELLFYREGNQTKIGANLTRSFGQRVVAYGEWAGGKRSNVIDQALQFGRRTGTIPIDAPSVLPVDRSTPFQNDLAVGASITPGTKITFNLEYHFHQAGFSRTDWNNWFNAGQEHDGSSPIAQELWYIREYSQDQQEPLTRHSAFLRADWPSAFTRNLELSGFLDTDLHDGSSLTQLAASYNFSGQWSAGIQTTAYLGSKASNFGSLPQPSSVLLEVTRFF